MAGRQLADVVRQIARDYSRDLDLTQEDHELAQDVIAKSSAGTRIRESTKLLGELLTRIILAPEPEIDRASNVFESIEVRRNPRFSRVRERQRTRQGKVLALVQPMKNDRERAVHERIRAAAQREYEELLSQIRSGQKDPKNQWVREQIKEFEVLRLSWGLSLGSATRAS